MRSPGRPMIQLGAFLRYIRAREALRRTKALGGSPPWTSDPILQQWRFTNIHRELDTTTQWIRRWTRPYVRQSQNVFMHLALARFVNYVPTLEALGWQSPLDLIHVRTFLRARALAGHKIWTSAYLVKSVAGLDKPGYVVDVLRRIETLLPELLRAQSLESMVRGLSTAYGVGDFMAQEIAQDVAHTMPWADAWPDRATFAVLGPGGRRGLNRVYGRGPQENVPRGQEGQEMFDLRRRICLMTDEFDNFTMHDVQFNLCEFDKYQRVALGEGAPRQRYRAR